FNEKDEMAIEIAGTITDADGRLEFEGLGDGKYWITSFHEDFGEVSTEVDITDGLKGPVELRYKANVPSKSTGVVEGQITIGGITPTIEQLGELADRQAPSLILNALDVRDANGYASKLVVRFIDSNGFFRMEGLVTSTYAIEAQIGQFQFVTKMFEVL